MRFAFRHVVGMLLIVSAVVATVGVFTFARPTYHPPNESKMIDFSRETYYAPAAVRRAFRTHGIALHGDVSQDGLTWLGAARSRFRYPQRLLIVP